MSDHGMDWTNLSWRRQGAAKHCNIVVTGDWAPIRHFWNVMLENPVAIYGDTLDVLRAADCRIVNLECAMDDGTPIIKSGPNLKGAPEHMVCLDVPRFDAATLANNHVMDFGAEAFATTMRLLDGHGVKHVGAGMNAAEATKSLILDVKGLKVGVVNYTEGQDGTAATADKPGVFGWDLDLVDARIAELRKTCDTVLAIVHCGRECIPYPPDYVRESCRRAADAGADAVIAHHPHVPQGLELHNDVPIFYSTGNYVFYQPTDCYYRKLGYLVGLDLADDGKLAGFKLHPYFLNDLGMRLLKGGELAEFSDLMQKLSAPLVEHGTEAWNAVLKELWHNGHLHDIVFTMAKMFRDETMHGAARLYNQFTIPANYEFFPALLRRVVDGMIDDVPDEYYELAKAYYERKIPDGPDYPVECRKGLTMKDMLNETPKKSEA